MSLEKLNLGDNTVLKTILKQPTLIPDVLESYLFDDDKVKTKIEKVYEAYKSTKQMPSESVLIKIFGDYTSANDADEFLIYRQLEEHNQFIYETKIQDIASDYSKTITPEIIQKIYDETIKSYGKNEEYRTSLNDEKDIEKLIKKYYEKANNIIKTGFSNIDTILQGGGYRPGSTYCFMGLSGTGKTIFTTNMARALWENDCNVLFISTEMDDVDISERILKSKYKVSTFQEAIISHQTAQKNPTTAQSGKLEIIKIHPGMTTVQELYPMIDKLDFKPSIIILDYADELAVKAKNVSEYDKHGEVYAALKAMAEIYKIPVITATQTNRSAEDPEDGGTKKYVGMNAISDSQKKLRTLDVLFSITKSAQDKIDNLIHLTTVKNRGGENGAQADFTINYQTMRLEPFTVLQSQSLYQEMTANKVSGLINSEDN